VGSGSVTNVRVSRRDGPAVQRWRAIVEQRRQQMDGAYAALNRTSADYWARRMGNRPSMLQRVADPDDPIVRTILAFADRSSTLLDVGAGAGRYTFALAPHFRRVVAVEPDAAMLQRLSGAIDERSCTNIEVIAATWQDATVQPADIVLCAHVLYPIADVEPFVGKLADSARRACVIALRDVVQEPEPLGRLWQRFHGEPRVLQPGYMDLCNVLYELGIRANLRVNRVAGPSWSFYDFEGAVEGLREHLILPNDARTDAILRAELSATLLRDGELLRLPVGDTYSAVIWWEVSE
jgi:2-polyprenyl-3-methyl-5-hydroxy-6-metoxy-1,4-benzoquinol methylase